MIEIKWKDQIETKVDNLIDNEVEADVRRTLDGIKISNFSKFCMKYWWVFLIIAIPSITGFFMLVDNPSSENGPLGLVTMLLMFLSLASGVLLVISAVTPSMIKSSVSRQFNHVELYKAISERVTNFSLDQYMHGQFSSLLGRPTRSGIVPPDARYDARQSYTYRGMFNDDRIEVTTSCWWWVRSNGKSSQTFVEYCSSIVIANPKCAEYNFSIIDQGRKIPGGKQFVQELENDYFNKPFNVYGDPIVVRKILNATEQEKLLLLQERFRGVQLDCGNGLFIITFNTPFGFMDPKLKVNANGIDYNTLMDDANKDFLQLLNIFSYYSSLRKLVNK